MVEVFYRGTRVATHLRSRTIQREPIVKAEHMPAEHRKYLTYNADNFMEWAASVGEHTAQVVKYFLTSGKEPEQGYKPCASMTKLAERYGVERMESACGQMISIASTPSIRTLSTIQKNGYDSRMSAKVEEQQTEAAHGFTRGAAYFQKGGASK